MKTRRRSGPRTKAAAAGDRRRETPGKSAPAKPGSVAKSAAASIRLPDWAILGLILTSALVLHGAAVRVPFFADDYLFLDQVRHRPLVTVLTERDPLGNFFRPAGRQLHFWTLSYLTRESPLAFHAVNVALFLAAVAILFLLARRLAGIRAAVVASSVLALHYAADVPIRWASGSQELWALTGTLATVLLYVSGRKTGAAPVFLFALLSKETVLLAPAVAIVADRAPGESWRAATRRAWPLGAAVAAWAALWVATRHQHAAVAAQGLSPLSPFAALVHLVQVTVGLEWIAGALMKNFAVQPPWLALAPVALAITWMGANGLPTAQRTRQALLAGGVWALVG